ncbi:MAG: cysteine desulfurase [Thaumarchaeota archaeon]|nr:cysteine desulfurase [Nitrososphaerota archaeon]
MNVEEIRRQFPILRRTVHGKPLIYLDSGATSQKPQAVIDAICRYYSEYNANVHRGVYQISEEATAEYEGARKKTASFINAKEPAEIVFTRGTTEAINLVAYSWGRKNIAQGDKIILTVMEHHSNIIPWQLLAKEKKAELEYVDIDEEGKLKTDELDELIERGAKLLALTHVSNVLGTVNPVKEIVRKAHSNGITVLLDGAQSVPHMLVDIQDIGCDFLTASGHKMLAPTGSGFLYARKELLEEMPPFLGGGDMIREVHLRDAKWNDVPWKFEAGTMHIEGAIGLGVAVDFLQNLGMSNVRAHEEKITGYALEKLSEVKGVRIYGPPDVDSRGGVVAFTMDSAHPHDIASILDGEGIAIRAGHHCAMPLMERLNVPATARASFYLYNKEEEVDLLAGGLEKVRQVFA